MAMDAEQLEEVAVMLPDDKIQEYREVFSFFDRDGGGTITSTELGQVMRTFGWNPTEGDLQVKKRSIFAKKKTFYGFFLLSSLIWLSIYGVK